jgi:glycosyltransferase involved in cell wall biosynthesis
MSTPAISVLLPVYNGKRYIAPAVRSILSQTERDFELLLCDDGSDDGTDLILKPFAADPRVKLVRTERFGLGRVCNHLLSMARGEFLARMDADDISLPDRFAAELSLMRADPNLAVIGTWLYIMDPAGRRVLNYSPPTDNASLQSMCMNGECPINEPSSMMRAEMVRRVGGWRPEMVPCGDIDLWLRLGEIGHLGMVDQPLQCYRLHPKSMSHTQTAVKRREIIRQICARAMERRGISGEIPEPPIWPEPNVDLHRQHLQYGWWAFKHGDRATALVYGWRAARKRFFDSQAWRLMACAAVKRAG